MWDKKTVGAGGLWCVSVRPGVSTVQTAIVLYAQQRKFDWNHKTYLVSQLIRFYIIYIEIDFVVFMKL